MTQHITPVPRTLLSRVLLVAVLAVAGCGEGTAPQTGTPTLQVVADRSVIQLAGGERLGLIVSLMNTASYEVEIPGGAFARLEVTDPNGSVMAFGRFESDPPINYRSRFIPPGDTIKDVISWGGEQKDVATRVTPGLYKIRVAVAVLNGPNPGYMYSEPFAITVR